MCGLSPKLQSNDLNGADNSMNDNALPYMFDVHTYDNSLKLATLLEPMIPNVYTKTLDIICRVILPTSSSGVVCACNYNCFK